ncbi:MAG: PepSY domain-containing protein [Novosphingobium sp.]
MNKLLLLPFALSFAVPLTPALADPGNAQDQARKDLRNGSVKPLRDIEKAVLPTMPGAQYLGPEYDPVAQAYRLKFIRNGRVIFIDVDARTGEVIRKLK